MGGGVQPARTRVRRGAGASYAQDVQCSAAWVRQGYRHHEWACGDGAGHLRLGPVGVGGAEIQRSRFA